MQEFESSNAKGCKRSKASLLERKHLACTRESTATGTVALQSAMQAVQVSLSGLERKRLACSLRFKDSKQATGRAALAGLGRFVK
jgi:hypothetical protein